VDRFLESSKDYPFGLQLKSPWRTEVFRVVSKVSPPKKISNVAVCGNCRVQWILFLDDREHDKEFDGNLLARHRESDFLSVVCCNACSLPSDSGVGNLEASGHEDGGVVVAVGPICNRFSVFLTHQV
jgi:hypothetical protein